MQILQRLNLIFTHTMTRNTFTNFAKQKPNKKPFQFEKAFVL